jgi:integrase/recombinase XerC
MSRLESDGRLTSASMDRLSKIMRWFSGFLLGAFDVRFASEVGPDHVRAFIEASTGRGSCPSVATMHVRRSAIRLIYRRAAEIGVDVADPTTNLPLPPRSYLTIRPLTDDEVELCRSFSRSRLSATRKPAAWALCEATARCSELPYVRCCDVHLDRSEIFIAGGAKTAPRWVSLTEWGLVQVSRRLSALKRESVDAPLIGSDRGTRTRARASAYDAIRTTIERAGLGQEPDVRPNSLVAWRGAAALAEGSSIDEVARMLGIRSLDAAASFIAWDWRKEES